MAWLREIPRKSGTVFSVHWRDNSRDEHSRNFGDRLEAEAFKAEIDRTIPPQPRTGNRQPKALADRIRASVKTDANGCWVWQRTITNAGYGAMTVQVPGGKPRTMGAHRVSYEIFVGRIPEGLQLDHLCRNRPCVNPEHLEPVTGSENVLRSPITQAAMHAAKTHCVNGHEFNEANTAHARGPNGRTFRSCRTCTVARAKEYRTRKAMVTS